MVQIKRADLAGKLDDIGPLQFLCVEWWDEAPKFALLRYAINDHEQELGVRIDLDKRAILDSVSNTFIDDGIKKNLQKIWEVVVSERDAVGC